MVAPDSRLQGRANTGLGCGPRVQLATAASFNPLSGGVAALTLMTIEMGSERRRQPTARAPSRGLDP